jgi:hypothetical protein
MGLRFTPFVLLSWHVALIVGACVLTAKLTIWPVRLALRMLVGAVRYSVAFVGLVAALVNRYRARQLRQNSSVGDPSGSGRTIPNGDSHCANWHSELSRHCPHFGPVGQLHLSFLTCHTANMSYDSVHKQARKRLRKACQRCRSTSRLQAALNPAAPQENLRLCPIRNSHYSIDLDDYMTLCSRCHWRMDYGARTACAQFTRARRNAPRCTVCGEPGSAPAVPGPRILPTTNIGVCR